MTTGTERKKKSRWWLLALLMLGGIVLVYLVRPEPEPIKLAVVSQTNDASGTQRIIVRVSNRSWQEFTVIGRSEALVENGTKWLPVNPGEQAQDTVPAGAARNLEFSGARRNEPWRVYVQGFRSVTRVQSGIRRCFSKLGWNNPYPVTESVLEFRD